MASWIQDAARLAAAGKLPLPVGVPRSVQVEQLVLALESDNLILMLGGQRTAPHDARALVAAAEWLASEANAQVAIVVAKADWHAEAFQRLPPPHFDLTAPQTVHSTMAQAAPQPQPQPQHTLSPLIGRPHPFSAGEQLLYSRLSQDAELGPLLAFNQLVSLGDFTQYRVDLLWQEGKVVVEIDGLREHLNRYAFVRDRIRDADLLVHGYLVLRLPHDLVMEDVDQAVVRIRRVIQLRQSGS